MCVLRRVEQVLHVHLTDAQVRKRIFSPTWYAKSDHFAKTGSGQTSRKLKKGAFCFSRSRSPTSPIASLRWRSRALSALKRPARALLTLCHRRGRRQRKLSPQQQRKTWRPLARTRRLSSSRLWPTQRCEKKRKEKKRKEKKLQIRSTQPRPNLIKSMLGLPLFLLHNTGPWCPSGVGGGHTRTQRQLVRLRRPRSTCYLCLTF